MIGFKTALMTLMLLVSKVDTKQGQYVIPVSKQADTLERDFKYVSSAADSMIFKISSK